ncbi:hypothetical protein E2320_013084 [Naja naja]|nr:hypothetical protein E2320_013084 [Naja naja]
MKSFQPQVKKKPMDYEPEANSSLFENRTTFQESIPHTLFKSFKDEIFLKKTNKPLLPLKLFSIYLNPSSALVKKKPLIFAIFKFKSAAIF